MNAFPRGRKPIISPSQLDMYFRCGEQWRRRYVCKEKIPPGIALLKGAAVHKAAEVNFSQKIESHTDLPLKDLQGAAEEHISSMVSQEGILLSAEENSRGMQTVLGEAKDRTYAMTGALHREIAPRIQPALVEEFVRIDLPNHSHDLLGRLDLATTDDEIVDLKTSSRKKNQNDIDRSDQLTFYGVAFKHQAGREPKGIRLEVIVETKVPSVQSLRSPRGESDKRILLNRINAMIAGVKAGVFLPAAPGSWLCSPKFCGYWETCPFVNSERRAAAEAVAKAGGVH